MTQNSIAKLLLATDESNSGAKVHIDDPEAQGADDALDNQFEIILDESIPYGYVSECLHLLKELEKRLQSDIYRGILLEVVQRISNEV